MPGNEFGDIPDVDFLAKIISSDPAIVEQATQQIPDFLRRLMSENFYDIEAVLLILESQLNFAIAQKMRPSSGMFQIREDQMVREANRIIELWYPTVKLILQQLASEHKAHDKQLSGRKSITFDNA